MLWLSWVDQCFPFCFLKLQLLCYILAGYLPFKQVQKPLLLWSIESLLPVGNSPVGLRACETPVFSSAIRCIRRSGSASVYIMRLDYTCLFPCRVAGPGGRKLEWIPSTLPFCRGRHLRIEVTQWEPSFWGILEKHGYSGAQSLSWIFFISWFWCVFLCSGKNRVLYQNCHISHTFQGMRRWRT